MSGGMEHCARLEEEKIDFLRRKRMVDDIVDMFIWHKGNIRDLALKIVTEVFERE